MSPKILPAVCAKRNENTSHVMKGASKQMLASTALDVEMVSAFATKLMVEAALKFTRIRSGIKHIIVSLNKAFWK
jgi:hypothetical protein